MKRQLTRTWGIGLVAIVAVAGLAGPASAAPADRAASVAAETQGVAKGSANETFAQGPGPYEVASTKVNGDCRGLMGIIAKIVASDTGLRCSDAAPYGFSSPVSTTVYYPDSDEQTTYPVIDFVGGIFSNDAQYETMARLWASNGFIVTSSTDFVNSYPEMHVLGVLEARRLNDDPASPLHGKVDLGRTILAGHSAGAAATLQSASFSSATQKIIDPDLRVIAAMPIEPGPVALGSTLKVPTFVLTGAKDTVVPAWSWPLLTQMNLIRKVPAWSATADTADHFSPVKTALSDNEFAGITTAFVLYQAYGDAEARSFFEGPGYRLAHDEQFITSPSSLLRVRRNELAAAL